MVGSSDTGSFEIFISSNCNLQRITFVEIIVLAVRTCVDYSSVANCVWTRGENALAVQLDESIKDPPGL